MNKRTYVYSFAFSASLAFACANVFAGEVDEQEPNQPIYAAQSVPADSGDVSVGALMGNADNDLDFYTFYGQAGDVVTVDIDGGIGGNGSVDTVAALFGPGPDYTMLRMNDDAPIDPGSLSSYDSRIENFTLPATGSYTVGVSNYPRYFQNGGTVSYPYAVASGDYSVVITGVTGSEQVKHVNIEIKPGDNTVAPINPKSRGKIPVAVLSSADFNAMDVDKNSLRFGASGDEASLSHCAKSGKDVNGDGRLDLVCHFANQAAKFKVGDLEGVLTGTTKDGTEIEGRGLLKVVPQKGNS